MKEVGVDWRGYWAEEVKGADEERAEGEWDLFSSADAVLASPPTGTLESASRVLERVLVISSLLKKEMGGREEVIRIKNYQKGMKKSREKRTSYLP